MMGCFYGWELCMLGGSLKGVFTVYLVRRVRRCWVGWLGGRIICVYFKGMFCIIHGFVHSVAVCWSYVYTGL